MLNIQKKLGPTPNSVQIILDGAIDSDNQLVSLSTLTEKEVAVNCAKVERINSIGLKGWVQIFKNLTESGISVQFQFFPPALVEQLNAVRNFLAGGKLASLMLPYSCTSCGVLQLIPISIADARLNATDPPNSNCQKCGLVTEFDDEPKEFFMFLNRSC